MATIHVPSRRSRQGRRGRSDRRRRAARSAEEEAHATRQPRRPQPPQEARGSESVFGPNCLAPARIRTLGLALIRQGNRILVECGRDEVKNETFFRLLGGTVEFGEKGAESVRRELLEELGVEAEVGRLVATIENLFMYEGEAAHEICLVYECSFRDRKLDGLDEWHAEERTPDGSVTHYLEWRSVGSFGPDAAILYPEGLLEMLRGGERLSDAGSSTPPS